MGTLSSDVDVRFPRPRVDCILTRLGNELACVGEPA
jgi:hypothetical protein